MLYHLFHWLNQYDFPGAQLFEYISFRAACAFILSLIVSMIVGKWMIKKLRQKQIGESIRDLGLAGQMEKKGTPTMGGLIIIAAILIPVLCFNRLNNVYVLLMIFTTIWLGFLGFMDDYIKVFKKNKEGLHPKAKLLGQIILGLVVGVVMYFHPGVVIEEKATLPKQSVTTDELFTVTHPDESGVATIAVKKADARELGPSVHSTKTTIPFVKNNEFDYAWFTRWLGDEDGRWSFLFYIPIIIFIIAAVSNGANLTDGLDGLATGTSATVAVGLAILAYVSGNAIFANYLNIMYIPNIGELVIFISALVGACIGFYWWNCFPAQVFMGDTGSLTLGGIIAVSCVIIRKELLIPLLCGVFLIQSLSVIMQVSYFKYTKKKYGEGRRILLMSPLHHHYQKKGMHESKIVQRFIVVSILLVVLTLVTLKIR
ncbi:MAG: phospho-N-acetylmuramoyl-pentapeptide-transferase [Bacteroidales bacterium]|jgi:phospho-N-acetylmuramoyl-pentapeptide-transferase|nr:phospho-N-acetylmuramoyl-pentapeptide-transferase [Bacteroidales bacterium]MBR4487316.1 phospho-N-acetylmuramoyl-pentapeptide-transferase [Bacteroidales bacterium]MBR4648487.1 phospho-N-acetylmuramoyl-pentapeptide-transferase [Bacteroidales bacterium]